jgi:YebC/PmpR family DNA-binding regulatory protein
MSGHSHAKKIKHQKEATDQKRGQMFSKIARMISVAIKQGGPNPATNQKLSVAMETAKRWNLPKENIERAIKRASGEEAAAEKLEEVSFEALGPGGAALIIEGITDNKNRALGDVKQILNQNGGKLVGEGAVRWMFEKKGVISLDSDSQPEEIKSKEELELLAIESGAQDLQWYDQELEVYVKPEDLEKVKNNLEEKRIKVDSFSVDWVAKETLELDEKQREACQKLFDALDENDSVQEIYTNANLS